MNLQAQRIDELCETLSLPGLATDYNALAEPRYLLVQDHPGGGYLQSDV